jgi:uncharacterized membrane protein (TIGR02234 family)
VIDRLTNKRIVLVLVLLSASVILVSGSRRWVSGSLDDAVLGAVALHGNGSQVAPGALAAALVGLASAVAATTGGTRVRILSACAALLAAVLGAAVVISIMVDPGGSLDKLASVQTGRAVSGVARGGTEVWAWVALAATFAMGLGGLGALVGAPRWGGLPSRYAAPGASERAPTDAGGQGATRQESAWDQLSRGEDPTAEH